MATAIPSTREARPSEAARPGRFGPYGGQFVPETLMPALAELIDAYDIARHDPAFTATYDALARDFIGRPTPSTTQRS